MLEKAEVWFFVWKNQGIRLLRPDADAVFFSEYKRRMLIPMKDKHFKLAGLEDLPPTGLGKTISGLPIAIFD